MAMCGADSRGSVHYENSEALPLRTQDYTSMRRAEVTPEMEAENSGERQKGA